MDMNVIFSGCLNKLCVFSQLDNPDEQAAQIRRELDGRLQMADQIARVKGKDGRGLLRKINL